MPGRACAPSPGLHLEDGPNFDRAHLRTRNRCRELGSLALALAVENVVSDQLLCPRFDKFSYTAPYAAFCASNSDVPGFGMADSLAYSRTMNLDIRLFSLRKRRQPPSAKLIARAGASTLAADDRSEPVIESVAR